MYIPDPVSWFLPIQDPESKNNNKREGWKKLIVIPLLVDITKFYIITLFIFEMLKKKIWTNFQRIIYFFPKKSSLSSQKDGLGIRDPGKTYSGSRIQGSRIFCSQLMLAPAFVNVKKDRQSKKNNIK